MAKLKLGNIPDDKPVRLSIELPAAIHRDLVAYADALGRETGERPAEPAKLIGPMLARFMATDRAFVKLRRTDAASEKPGVTVRVAHEGDKAASARVRASGIQARSSCRKASGSSIGLKATLGSAAAARLLVKIVMPNPAATRARIDCLLAAWLRRLAPLPSNGATKSRSA